MINLGIKKPQLKFMKLLAKLLVIITLFLFFAKELCAKSIKLIRDSQTEDFLWQISTPLIKAANLNKNDIKIYIVNDANINAFVTGGQNIFINSGLITKYKDPNILIGVIAHEIGHIAAGHLAKGSEAYEDLSKVAILSYLAGIAAAASGNVDAGYAILMGGNHLGQRLALRHTRTQEEAADKLALDYLSQTNNSPLGLMILLDDLGVEYRQYQDVIDEYALTHPISRKRVNYIKANLQNFNSVPKTDINLWQEFQYVRVKLRSFLEDPNKILQNFNKSDLIEYYARAIAYFKKGQIEKSLVNLDYLIKKYPKNGYFYELKGQILFESGQIVAAIKSYQNSLKFLPNSTLAKISLSQAIITLKNIDFDLAQLAIKNLQEAKKQEKHNLQIYQQLAKAYKILDQDGKSYLALAELNLLKNNNKKAKKYAKLAIKNLDNSDKAAILQSQDILEIIKDDKDNGKL